jgi:hypothetical protein
MPATPPRRELARDTATDRVGEIMPDPIPARLRNPDSPRRVRLRPVGGGLEWTARSEDVELIPAEQTGD